MGAVAVGEDFVIALPYGPGADWVRNVLAQGTAELIHEGRTVAVRDPELVATAEVLGDLPVPEQRALRLFAVDRCLRLRPAPEG